MIVKCPKCQIEREFEIINENPLILFCFVNIRVFGNSPEENTSIVAFGRIFTDKILKFNDSFKKVDDITYRKEEQDREIPNLFIDKIVKKKSCYNITSSYIIRHEKKLRFDLMKIILRKRIKRIVKEDVV